MPHYDAILVPGGGVRPGGELPVWVRRRLDLALAIRDQEYLIALSAGTTHKPPLLDEQGFPIFESIAAARYLIQRGVDARKILTETSSYDTLGNAFFSRVIHAEPRGFKRLLVITSEFHMARTESIFRWLYHLDDPQQEYRLDFLEVSDEGISDDFLNARHAREQASLDSFNALKERINTLAEFHTWLFAHHTAYAVLGQPTRIEDADALETY